MNILRAQRETLMSVLRPFVYDPLLSWSSRSNNTSKSVSTERMDKESMRSVENIEKRLKGIVSLFYIDNSVLLYFVLIFMM